MAEAVVVGAGVAGLLAARVLAERFARVTIIERDAAPAGSAGARKGVPQGRHVHALLVRGLRAVETLLPGLAAEAVRDGGIAANAAQDAAWGLAGTCLARADDDLPVVVATRPFLESRIRARMQAIANVAFRHGTGAAELVWHDGRVAGIRLLAPDGGAGETIEADLVIDATGRGSDLPAQLQAHGYPAPPEDSLAIGVGYTTVQFHDAPDLVRRAGRGERTAIIVGATPDCPRSGVMHRVEGGRLEVSLSGYQDNHPPRTLSGFIDFAATLALPDLHRIVAHAVPCSDPAQFRVPRTMRRQYERLSRFPAGILPIGDAICAFNPIFAQGMSVAAMEALALRQALADQPLIEASPLPVPRLARAYLAAVARLTAPAWAMARASDLMAPHLRGGQRRMERLMSAWIARVIRGGGSDPELARRFIRVASLVDPPGRLIAPSTVWRVLWPARAHARRSGASAAVPSSAPPAKG